MSLLLLGAGITLIALSFILIGVLENKDTAVPVATVFVMVGLVLFILSLPMILWNSVKVVHGRTYDKKIEMYQSENKKIEKQVDAVVVEYMEHEDETFADAKNGSSMTLVSLYPELKSDALVKEQIKMYNENNSEIKELKESQIDVSTAKWWLYFGG